MIKICGLKSLSDIELVNKYKPDFVGFVFANGKRQIHKSLALTMKKALDPSIQTVGVFVNEKIETIAHICNHGIIDFIQLHGDETPDYIQKLKTITHKPIIKAIRLQDETTFIDFDVDYLLFDTYAKNEYGGTGVSFNWEVLKKLSITKPFFLAGGISVHNLEDAFHLNPAPYCVDASSSLEENGIKNERLIKQFVEKKERIIMSNSENNRIFGIHGGRYIPETLMNTILELEENYKKYMNDEDFQQELRDLYANYANRPSLLYFAEKMTKDLGGAKIYLKREDLNHTGSHKINNVLGQILLAKKMGKKKVIAETGAGQHGVATATVAALMGMECEVYMGKEDTERQKLNVFRMELLGAKVHAVTAGTATLKDAVSEAMRVWTASSHDTFYVIGSVMGPSPYPQMVRDFQRIIGKEVKEQLQATEGKLPDVLIACVGGGSNAMGLFYDFLEDKNVKLIGVEAGGEGIETGRHAATISTGSVGIFHGMKSYFVQDNDGQIAPVYSISAGLDYPGIGPEHAYLHDTKRAEYVSITDKEAVDAFLYLSRTEGIIPAIESSHAVAYCMKIAKTLGQDKTIVVNLSGRGDKDVAMVAKYMGVDVHE